MADRPLNVGDRVVTPRGFGTLAGEFEEGRWIFGRPVRRLWLIVDLDTGGRVSLLPADVKHASDE